MVGALTEYTTSPKERLALTTLLQSGHWGDEAIKQVLKAKGHTQASLLEKAISNKHDELQKLDQLIALRVKTLTQLQQSYEALVNRSILQERLKLQNELIKRDLEAIDIPAVAVADTTDDKSTDGRAHGKRKTKSSQ
jgi:hypothetical protein